MIKKITVFFVLLVGCLIVVKHTLYSQESRKIELTAQNILVRADEILKYPTGLLNGKLKHIYPNGKAYSLDFNSSISEEDFLFTFSRVGRGEQLKILYKLSGDDIWVYNIHSIELFHKIGVDRFDQVLGTNFAYLDISNSDYQSSYTAKLEGSSIYKGIDVYKLRLKPIFEDGMYGQLVFWISKSDYTPLRIDYYDTDNVIIKFMTIAKTIKHKNRIFPIRYDMMDIRKGTISILVFDKIDDRIKFNKEIFQSEKLGE